MRKNKPHGVAGALLAGALLGGLMTAPGAHAVDFRVKGVWIAMLEYGEGGSFVRKDREGKNVQGWGRGARTVSRPRTACACNWMPRCPMPFPAASISR